MMPWAWADSRRSRRSGRLFGAGLAAALVVGLGACAPAPEPAPRPLPLAEGVAKGRAILDAGTQALADEFDLTWGPNSDESLEWADAACRFRTQTMRSATDLATQSDGANRTAKALTTGLKSLGFGEVAPLTEGSGGWKTTSPQDAAGAVFSVGSLGYTDADVTVPVDLLEPQCSDEALNALG